jgi:hypothetical protein
MHLGRHIAHLRQPDVQRIQPRHTSVNKVEASALGPFPAGWLRASRRRSCKRKNPQQFPAGGPLVVRRSGSEVALNANVEGGGVLVVEGKGLNRLRSTRRERGTAREALGQMGPDGFSRERQVLDRRPSGHDTQHRDGVVRIAGISYTLAGDHGAESTTYIGRRSGVIPHPARTAEQAARPIWIPVVVEGTTDTVGCGQMDRAIAAVSRRKPDTVRGRAEADGAAGSKLTGNTAEHQEVRGRT